MNGACKECLEYIRFHDCALHRALKWYDKHGANGLQGNGIWKDAIAAGLFPGRSFESLQTHFRPNEAKAGERGAVVYHQFQLRLASHKDHGLRTSLDSLDELQKAGSTSARAPLRVTERALLPSQNATVSASARAHAPPVSVSNDSPAKRTQSPKPRARAPAVASAVSPFTRVKMPPSNSGVVPDPDEFVDFETSGYLQVTKASPSSHSVGSALQSARQSSPKLDEACDGHDDIGIYCSARNLPEAMLEKPGGIVSTFHESEDKIVEDSSLTTAQSNKKRRRQLPEKNAHVGSGVVSSELEFAASCENEAGYVDSSTFGALRGALFTGGTVVERPNRPQRDWGGSPSQSQSQLHSQLHSSLLEDEAGSPVTSPEKLRDQRAAPFFAPETLQVDEIDSDSTLSPLQEMVTRVETTTQAARDIRPATSDVVCTSDSTNPSTVSLPLTTWLQHLRATYGIAIVAGAVRASLVKGSVVRGVVDRLLQAGFGTRFGTADLQATMAEVGYAECDGGDPEENIRGSKEEISNFWRAVFDKLSRIGQTSLQQ